jgi:hypothetical protein
MCHNLARDPGVVVGHVTAGTDGVLRVFYNNYVIARSLVSRDEEVSNTFRRIVSKLGRLVGSTFHQLLMSIDRSSGTPSGIEMRFPSSISFDRDSREAPEKGIWQLVAPREGRRSCIYRC